MSSNSIFSSEILPIKLVSKNYQRFRVNPDIDRKIGNRISWRLSDRAEGRIVIFDSKTSYFWVLGKPEITLPSDPSSWQVYLNPVLVQLHDDLGDIQYKIEEVENTPIITTTIEAELAIQVLKFSEQIRPKILVATNNINVETDVDYWSEQFEFKNIINPAITVNLKTRIIYKKDLQDFLKNHPQNSDPKKLLIDLQVKPVGSGSTASILRLAGTLGERRKELITKASSPVIQDKLLKGADEELIVSIRFGKKGALYDYPLGALKPLITAQTSYLFDVKYGDLLKETKRTFEKGHR